MTVTERGAQRAEERNAVRVAAGGEDKSAYVRAMFSSIAPKYDLLNHLLSLNVDRRWRRRALRSLNWERAPRGTYLDLCAGTLDVALELANRRGFSGTVLGADFAEPMLRAGQGKLGASPVRPLAADALALPLPDGICDGAIAAFGMRNLANLDAGLREVQRVLRPSGRFVILEFTTPPSPAVRWAYHLYFHRLLPRIGALISGNRGAYRYLPESVAHFPAPEDLAAHMRLVGFSDVHWSSLTLGIAAIHVGTRR